MLTLYSSADAELYAQSSGALYSCTLRDNSGVRVVDISTIESVVAMVPHSYALLEAANLGAAFKDRVFVVERPGLEVMALGEMLDPDDED